MKVTESDLELLKRYAHDGAESALEGSAALSVRTVTGGAAQLLKEAFAAGCDRSGSSTAGEPCLILRRLHDHYLSNHAGVHGAAILRAKQVIDTGLRSPEPRGGIAPRDHVLLDAEGRNIQAVDHVLRGHDQFDVATNRHVQLVDLPLTLLMLEFPHPLLGYDINFGCAPGRSSLVEVNDRAPNENDHEESERNH